MEKEKMGYAKKTEEQLTQEIMKLIDQLYDTMGGEPAKTKEAIQDKIASILSGTEQRVEQIRKERKEKKVAAGQKSSLTRFSDEDRQKINLAMEKAIAGEIPSKIAEDTGMSESAVFDWMSKREIFTRKKVVEAIGEGKSNAEIHLEGKWKIDAIQEVRAEVERKAVEKEKRRLEAELEAEVKRHNKELAKQETLERRREKDRQRKAKKDAERRAIKQVGRPEGVQARRVEPLISKQDEATFLKLAQSLTSVKKIAKQLELPEEKIREALYDYNIFTREEVVEWLGSKSDVQIALMGNLDDHRIVERVRKEESARKLAEEIEGNGKERQTAPEAQKKKEDEMFLRMAKNYEPVEKIGSVFQMNEYKVILRLRKLKLYSRPEVERMIETGEVSDIKIAGTVGNVNAIARIRRKIQKRELLIRSIPEDKRVRIRERIAAGIAVSSIAYDTRINSSIIMAMQEKWKRDKDLQISEERKKVNLNIDWLHLETDIRDMTVASPNTKKNSIEYTIEKLLVIYAKLLTQRHYAYIAYAYMKMGRYMDGIEFAEDYLNLENSSIKGVKDRINEILDQEKDEEKSEMATSSQNMRIEWPEMEELGG